MPFYEFIQVFGMCYLLVTFSVVYKFFHKGIQINSFNPVETIVFMHSYHCICIETLSAASRKFLEISSEISVKIKHVKKNSYDFVGKVFKERKLLDDAFKLGKHLRN